MFRRKAFRIVLATARAVAVVSVLSVQLLTARGHTAHANGSVALWRFAFSVKCNNPTVCGPTLSGASGSAELDSDNTAVAQLTNYDHLQGSGPASGAQHSSAQASWFIALGMTGLPDFFIGSETRTFTGRSGGPPVTLFDPFPLYPSDTGIPAVPAHYNAMSLFGLEAPPGFVFNIQVVQLHP
jgi:hypothetical protein